MASYREKIEAVQKEISANEALIRADQRAIGKALVEGDVDLSANESLAEQAETAKQLSQQIAEIEEQIRAVGDILDERAANRETIEAKEADIRTLQDGLSPIYEEIGQAAFQRFQENPFVDQEHAQIFSDLVKHHDELRDVQGDLDRLDSTMEQKPFLEKVVARGKRIVLANRLAAKESAERRLFRKVGRDVTRTDFIQKMDDPSLAEVARPYYDTEKRIEDLTHDVENLRSKEEKANESLADQVGDQRPDRFIAKRESERDALVSQRDDSYVTIGTAVAAEEVAVDAEQTGVSSLLAEISQLEKDNAGKRQTITRLEAALRVEELDRQIARRTETIDSLKMQIENLDKQVAEHSDRVEDLKREKAEQEKARGPADEI